jgi:hypothetical protein
VSHTPGPWTLQNADDADPWNLGSMWVTDASARVMIADPENNDDARLIAAAPDLLAALQAMLAEHEQSAAAQVAGAIPDGHDPAKVVVVEFCEHADAARDAIAKATASPAPASPS